MKFRHYLLFVFPLLFGCQEENPPPEVNSDPRLDSLITAYVEQLRVVTDNTAGLAIGVTTEKEILYTRAFGFASVEKGVKATTNTPFHLASLSKPFSAVAILQLIEDGQLGLDDKIVDLIPAFTMAEGDYDQITVEHLLTHTSGIPRNIAVDDWLNPSYGPEALDENLGILSERTLDFIPGQSFSYSNSGFDLLGVVISRVSGMPFHQYLQEKIFAPLGMENTSLQMPEDQRKTKWADAHSYGLSTQPWSPFPYNERLFPSSGVVSSLTDMCKWGQFHLGRGNLDEKRILPEASFDQLVTPHYDTPWGDKIGLSWFLQSYLDRPIIMHTGFDTGFEAMMYIYPEDDISIVVLANRDFSRTGRIINAVSEIVFGEQPKAYQVSAKYPFAQAYRENGMENAVALWEKLKQDTTDVYLTDDEDLLTTGAILENGGSWKASRDILKHYLSIDQNSTYAWRLLGNTYLNLGDTTTAKSCYQRTLAINPEYEKGKLALQRLAD